MQLSIDSQFSSPSLFLFACVVAQIQFPHLIDKRANEARAEARTRLLHGRVGCASMSGILICAPGDSWR